IRSYDVQINLVNECDANNNSFWKRILNFGIVNERFKQIPVQVVLEDGITTYAVKTVLSNAIYTDNLNNGTGISVNELDKNLNILENVKAVEKAKSGKATRVDSNPVEVLKNESAGMLLHILFHICFQTGKVPSSLSKNITNPIPKSTKPL
ncbi:hypothetical protein MAR_031185, partial [Mya arenaria]